MKGHPTTTIEGVRAVPPYPPDPVVVAEVRRLAAEDLDRDLGQVADLLAERGHRGPDGEPLPPRMVANLLDADLRHRRDERRRERARGAAEGWTRWHERHGEPFADLRGPVADEEGQGAGQDTRVAADPPGGSPDRVDAVPTPRRVPAEAFPLTPAECWLVMRGHAVRPARGITAADLDRLPGGLRLVDGRVVLGGG